MNLTFFKKTNHTCGGAISMIWIIPAALFIILFLFIPEIKSKIIQNSAGKPGFISATGYGKIDSVFIKAGDIIEPGKEICSFVSTDEKGQVPKQKIIEDAIDVTVRELKGEKFVDAIELPGITSPYLENNISAQVSGKIIELPYKEGTKVKKGDLIALIDKSDYKIALERAQADYDYTKSEFERSSRMLETKVATPASHDQKDNDLKMKKAALDNAKLSYERCEILAPFDGIIDKKYAEAGENVAPGEKIAKIINISTVKVNIGIPEKDVNYIKNLNEIKFYVPSLNNKEFTGTFSNVVVSMNETVKIYPLIIDVNNKDNELLPGMIVKAKIIRKTYDSAILLPIFSVIPGDDEYYTFISQNGTAVKKVLELGTFQDKSVHIVKGLEPGDKIIDKGLKLVNDGVKVRIINQ